MHVARAAATRTALLGMRGGSTIAWPIAAAQVVVGEHVAEDRQLAEV